MNKLANMRDVHKALDTLLLPSLRRSGWEGKGIAMLHKVRDGHDIWTVLFGWPKGMGPSASLSVDVGIVPKLVGWKGAREAALRLLCNGWDSAGLAYHVPQCWRRRFPEEPVSYAKATSESLANRLGTLYEDIEQWAADRTADELRPLADELAALKGPANAGARKWARNYRKVLGD